MPTPLGFGYYLMNPSAGKPVEFDDCQQMTGIMMDYKDRYWKLLSDPDTQGFTIRKLWKQALDQVQTAGERTIRWYFSEKQSADSANCFAVTVLGAASISFMYQCRTRPDE
jgi:hypothetical protein